MNSQLNKKGFTIIEVVLVLAIAGLIFMMVFLALPALQRSQRDAQRKSDLGRIQAAINSYQSSHRGRLPETSGWNTFVKDYVSTEHSDEFIDPSGAPDGSSSKTYDLVSKNDDTLSGSFKDNQNRIYYAVGTKCSEDGAKIVSNQGNRKVAFRMRLENGGWHCVNN